MFKIFKSNKNTVVDFLQKKDVEIANAYRANTATKLNNGFSSVAASYIARDIKNNRRIDNAVTGISYDTKYSPERYIKRDYEIISEDDTQCIIKRFVNFKAVDVSKRISTSINDSFAEIFTISKTANGFRIEKICAA